MFFFLICVVEIAANCGNKDINVKRLQSIQQISTAKSCVIMEFSSVKLRLAEDLGDKSSSSSVDQTVS